MKTTLIFLLAIVAILARAQSSAERVYQAGLAAQAQANAIMAQEMAAEAAERAREAAIAQHAKDVQTTLNTFPWRSIDGVTQHVAVTWCTFSGNILQIHPGEGARIDGEFHTIYPDHQVSFTGEFFVKNYPFKQADDDIVPGFLAAQPSDVYTYNTAQGSVHSIHSLDFGIPCDPPAGLIEEEKKEAAAAAIAAQKEKKAAQLKALQANEQEAANGDMYGLLRMGERYRDGDGVETNLEKSRECFSRAAAMGDLIASNELAALPQ